MAIRARGRRGAFFWTSALVLSCSGLEEVPNAAPPSPDASDDRLESDGAQAIDGAKVNDGAPVGDGAAGDAADAFEAGPPPTSCGVPVGSPWALTSSGADSFLASDDAFLYWFNEDTFPSRSLLKISKQGGSVTTLVSGLLGPEGIVVRSGTVYFATGDYAAPNTGSIQSVPSTGGNVATFLSGAPLVGGLAVDDSDLYWTIIGPLDPATDTSGTVVKEPLAGGSPVTIAAGQAHPRVVTVDATNVYWANWATSWSDGTIAKAPIAGGPVTVLASGQNRPMGIAVANGFVYWIDGDTGATDVTTDNGSLNRVPLAGGAVEQLATQQLEPTGMTVDLTSVYWGTLGSYANATELQPGAVWQISSDSRSHSVGMSK